MDWLNLLEVQGTLKRVFSHITVQKHRFFGTQLSLGSNSHIHTWPLEKPQPWLDRPLLAKKCLWFLACCFLDLFVGRDKLGDWGWHTYSTVFKTDNQQKLIFCNNLSGKIILKRMGVCICVTGSLCYTPQTNRALLIAMPQYKIKIKRWITDLTAHNRKTKNLVKTDRSSEHTVFRRKQAFSQAWYSIRGIAGLPLVGKNLN